MTNRNEEEKEAVSTSIKEDTMKLKKWYSAAQLACITAAKHR